MKHVYVSCPMTIKQSDLDDVIKLVQSQGVTPMWWSRGTGYDEKFFKDVIMSADAFVIILPEMKWSCPAHEMTSGSRKELKIALEHNKDVYLAYKNRNDGLGIYATEIEQPPKTVGAVFRNIKGIASTRHNFKEDLVSKVQPEQVISESWIDTVERDYQQYIKAQSPFPIPTINRSKGFEEKFMEIYQQAGIMFIDSKEESVVEQISVIDNRLLLFF